jgi:peptidoglycan/xylan/chitin deacetylase (PgdA/CDA1 family)
MTESRERAFGRRRFDELFGAAEDPWQYSSHYETTKYRQTLSLVPDPPPRRALEVGCAEGHFTEQLASKVGALTAVDISALALERAQHRCAACSNVTFAQLDLFEDPLPGQFDLIVCSELLYYASDLEVLQRAAAALMDALGQDGCLVTAHPHLLVDGSAEAAFDWEGHVAGAAGIERALLATHGLTLTDEIRTDLYRVQRYIRSTSAAPVHRRIEPTGVLLPNVSSSVVWNTEPAADGRRLTILTYHRVSEHGPPALDSYRIDPDSFEATLGALWKAGYRTIPLEQWRRACAGHGSLPRLPLLLTFDDGYLDFLTGAWPALKRHGFGALVSVVTDRVGGFNEWDAEHQPPLALMDWDTIVNLHKQGVDFAAHSATHRRLTELDPVEATREIWSSKVRLEEQLEDEITTFVYPWNTKDERVESLVRACGFACALAGRVGIAVPGDNPFELPRIEIEDGARPETTLHEIARAREQPQAASDRVPPHPPGRWRAIRWRIAGKARALLARRR